MALYLGSKMVSALSGAAGGSSAKPPVLEELTVTENNTYTPGEGVDGFSKVVVNVESPIDLESLVAVCDAINGEAVDGESVEAKVMRLMNTKEDIKAALIEKGQTVTDADAFSSYADKIRAIKGTSKLEALTVTENGIYTPGEGIDGYSSVTVAIEGATGWGGTLTDTLSWELGTTGTLAIVGTGAMPDYTAEYQPWLVHKDIIKDIIILSGVTHIGRYAFYNCANLETVTIPTSVKSIRDNAFNAHADYPNPVGVYIKSLYSWCDIDFDEYGHGNPINALKNLYVNGELVTDLVIPSDVFSIPDNAFNGCSMTSLSFQGSTCRIGKAAFSGCQQLKNVTLPSDLTEIPKSAFGLCTSLQSIVIPDKVTTIGNLAFLACASLKEVTIGSGVTKIVTSAFSVALTSLTFKVTNGWKVYNKDTDTTPIKSFTSAELDDPAEAAAAFNQHLTDYWKRT